MARQIAWIVVFTLALALPASASSLCGLEAAAQADQPATRTGDHEKDKRQEHRPFKFWQGDAKTELGITNQQSAEIEQIFQATMPRLEAAKEKLDKLEATLSQTIKDNTADLATVAQQVDRLESARAELFKTRTLMLYRMRGLLSAEQRAKLQARWEADHHKSPDSTGRR